jgi:4-hydroxy-3-polyprenylbenzoate decarboxylase
MPYNDLREFIRAVEKIGESRVVEGADWDLEIGTIAELNYERQGPALVFDRIKGYPKGYRILANALDSIRRALLAVGLPVELDLDAALDAYDKKLASYRPLPPVEVRSGPVLENVFRGEEIDLWKFPTPRWHEKDGGRYLGTGCMVIMKDPDSGTIHFGCYRVMIHDKKTAGLYISPSHRGAIIRKKYWEKGQSAPVAIVFGMEPSLFLASAQYLGRRREMGKYELAGFVRGEPVEVVREVVTGLPIPATAEIVIAGTVPPPNVEARDEGPFGEWTGYYASGTRPEPVIRIEALYHRNEPIILGMPPVKHYKGPSHFGLPSGGKNEIEKLRRAGVEDVLDVWHLAVPGVTVVQIHQRYPGHAMKTALTVASGGHQQDRFFVVVDEDINPRDPEEVLWAIGTRCDPETSITVLKGCPSGPLNPRIPPEQKKRGDFTSSRAVINACKPYEWLKEFPTTNVASPELRTRVLEKWRELF